MDRTRLKEDFNTGLFEDDAGRWFVRCDFNPEAPVWIDVSQDEWVAQYAGTKYKLSWSKLDLPDKLALPLRQVIQERLKSRSPSYLAQVNSGLKDFIAAAKGIDLSEGFSHVSSSAWLKIWGGMKRGGRTVIRSLYIHLTNRHLAGADHSIAIEMKRWRARNNTVTLSNVREWNVVTGAMTAAEDEVLRRALAMNVSDESDHDIACRVYGLILHQTMKRPLQILSMKADAFDPEKGKEAGRHYLDIPKVKGQAGEDVECWEITKELADLIQTYSDRPRIARLQRRIDRLMVIPNNKGGEPQWIKNRQMPAWYAYGALKSWIVRRRIVSPRTRATLHLTARRIRHSGATGMIMRGASIEDVQYVLEHKSPYSANAYVDALGSELAPALEKMSGEVGRIFSELSRAFFQGSLVDRVGRRPIHIPVVAEGPAAVGTCGSDTVCEKHPFWSCYDGCPHFLAWREADHYKALSFIKKELKRWNGTAGTPGRTKSANNFERIGAAILEVIKQIDETDRT